MEYSLLIRSEWLLSYLREKKCFRDFKPYVFIFTPEMKLHCIPAFTIIDRQDAPSSARITCNYHPQSQQFVSDFSETDTGTLHILRDDRRLTHCLFPDVYMGETYNPAYFKNNNDNNNNLKSKMLRALMLLHSQPKWLFCVVSHLLSKHALYPAHAHKRLQLLLSCSTTKPKFACCSLSCS